MTLGTFIDPKDVQAKRETMTLSGPAPLAWPAARPIKARLLPIPPYKSELLPEPLAAYVTDNASRQSSPPEFIAVGLLTCLGIVLGSRIALRPKHHDDWQVYPNLWGMCVGRPSTKKTPALAVATASLNALEKAAKQQYEAEQLDNKASIKLATMEAAQRRDQAKVALKEGNRESAERLMLEAETLELSATALPARQRYLTSDATVEMLGELLKENRRGIMLLRDELSGWLSNLTQERGAGERSFYLEGWNGGGRFTYDRIGRGTVDIESVTIAVLGGIQPGKLGTLLRMMLDGSGDDGLVQRFQLAVYPDPPTLHYCDRAPNLDARREVDALFHRLSRLEATDHSPLILHFDGEAQRLFEQWCKELYPKIRDESLPSYLESHLAKYESLLCRLCIVLHMTTNDWRMPVDCNTFRRAAAWCQLLEAHARRIYAVANDPTHGAKTLSNRLHRLPKPFASRDVLRLEWTGLNTPDAVKEALALLEEHGHVVRQRVATTGRARTDYWPNPELHRDERDQEDD